MQSLIMHLMSQHNFSRTMKKSKGSVMKGEWQIDKTVSIGHIVSSILLATALVTVWSNMNTKIETQGVRINAVESRIDREAQRQREDMAQIRESLNRIEDRLERITDK